MAAVHAAGRVPGHERPRGAHFRRPRSHRPVAPPASKPKTCYTHQGVEEDMNVIHQLEKEQQKEKVPALRAGDTVRVHAKVVEGTREPVSYTHLRAHET